MFVELLMLLFDGRVKADDGSLGKLSRQFNEDVGDETMADVMWSAMIDEGDDCDDYRSWEERVGVFMGWGIKRRWTSRV